MTSPASQRSNKPTFWLAVASLGFGLAQLLLMDMDRYLAWDEAVYFAEVNPRVDAIDMYAHRARGVTLVAAPVALISDSIFALRTFLVAISTVGLFGAFNTWRTSISWAAPVSAALFGSTWLALAYGSELMPNYYSALLAVATVGLAISYYRSHEVRMLVLASSAVALATLVRPLDGAVLVLTIGLSGFMVRDAKHLRLISGSVIGAAVGGLPWVVEAWARFDGPLERLELTREVVGGGLTNNVGTYLEMLAAPLSAGELATSPQMSALWILALLSLSAAGLVLTKGQKTPVTLLTLLASALLAAPYVFYSEAATPRFMIPAVALLSVSAGIGVIRVFQLERPHAWGLFVAMVLLLLVAFNATSITQWSTFQSQLRSSTPVLGEVLAGHNTEGPCFFLSSYGYPQISVASGCNGGGLTSDAGRNVEQLNEAQAEGNDVYALVASQAPVELLDTTWECEKVPTLPDSRWHLCSADD